MSSQDKPDTAPPQKEAQADALLLKALGDIPAGRIVRGPASEIRALPASVARPATPKEVAIAGSRTVRLPRR